MAMQNYNNYFRLQIYDFKFMFFLAHLHFFTKKARAHLHMCKIFTNFAPDFVKR